MLVVLEVSIKGEKELFYIGEINAVHCCVKLLFVLRLLKFISCVSTNRWHSFFTSFFWHIFQERLIMPENKVVCDSFSFFDKRVSLNFIGWIPYFHIFPPTSPTFLRLTLSDACVTALDKGHGVELGNRCLEDYAGSSEIQCSGMSTKHQLTLISPGVKTKMWSRKRDDISDSKR